LHLALDAANTYGVHPFFPLDNRWYYGDAFFVFEPWLWVVLATAAAANAATLIGRAVLVAFLVVLPGSTALLGLVPWESVVILAALTLTLARALKHRSPKARAGLALALCGAFAVGMVLISRQARSTALAEIVLSGDVLDIVLTPSPGLPVCWAVIAIERDDQAGRLVLRRGSLSLLPHWRHADACPFNRFATSRARRAGGTGRFSLVDEYRLPLEDLRALAEDCRSSAWLRFARAPVFGPGRLFDLRFENEARGNFTSMRRDAGGSRPGCPAYVPHWEMPRADALTR
jgi:inner membrane protein